MGLVEGPLETGIYTITQAFGAPSRRPSALNAPGPTRNKDLLHARHEQKHSHGAHLYAPVCIPTLYRITNGAAVSPQARAICEPRPPPHLTSPQCTHHCQLHLSSALHQSSGPPHPIRSRAKKLDRFHSPYGHSCFRLENTPGCLLGPHLNKKQAPPSRPATQSKPPLSPPPDVPYASNWAQSPITPPPPPPPPFPSACCFTFPSPSPRTQSESKARFARTALGAFLHPPEGAQPSEHRRYRPDCRRSAARMGARCGSAEARCPCGRRGLHARAQELVGGPLFARCPDLQSRHHPTHTNAHTSTSNPQVRAALEGKKLV